MYRWYIRTNISNGDAINVACVGQWCRTDHTVGSELNRLDSKLVRRVTSKEGEGVSSTSVSKTLRVNRTSNDVRSIDVIEDNCVSFERC